MAFRVISKRFTSRAVETMTGVSTSLQRQWRSAGLLAVEKTGLQTRYLLTDVVKILARRLLSDAGLTREALAPHLEALSTAILVTLVQKKGVLVNASTLDDEEMIKAVADHYRPSIPGGLVLDLFAIRTGRMTATQSSASLMAGDMEELRVWLRSDARGSCYLIDVEGAVDRLVAATDEAFGTAVDADSIAGTLASVQAELRRTPSLIRRAREAAKAHGVDLYSDEGLALARALLREAA